MTLSTENRASWFERRTVWTALALGVVACGGNSSTTVGEDGSGGAPLGGEKGSSGGRSSGDGGRAAGGRDGSGSSASDGGASVGGAPEGDGGSLAGGTSSGGDSSGGAPGTGGAGGEDDHLYGLGDECETPGEFSCSAANELLALICGGDRKWAVRETCESGEKCDFRSGSGVGLCRVPVPGCETNVSEPICGERGVETCTRGGFETEVIEGCGEGYGCEDAECVMVDDECPETGGAECEDYPECGGRQLVCSSRAECLLGVFDLILSSSSVAFRLPDAVPCGLHCPSTNHAPGIAVHALHSSPPQGPEMSLRFSVGPGWQIRGMSFQDGGHVRGCNDQVAEKCMVVPFSRTDGVSGYAGAIFYPLTSPAVTRNVLMEVVPSGTICD